jgi:hypothetical protein
VSLNLLKKWIDERKEKKEPELSRLQMFALVDFVNWLDTQRSLAPRAAEGGDGADDLPLVLKCAKCFQPRMRYGRYLQPCPNCGDEGIDLFEDVGNL